jgi:hypothetical protein
MAVSPAIMTEFLTGTNTSEKEVTETMESRGKVWRTRPLQVSRMPTMGLVIR